MPAARFGNVIQFLYKTCGIQEARDLADRELLEKFLTHKDENAFAALVERHGPMVFSVCRRVLGDPHEAEDVFQATFLVLVRRMRSIGRSSSIGGWLHESRPENCSQCADPKGGASPSGNGGREHAERASRR